jgi:pyruvate formate lyase activating enzyme
MLFNAAETGRRNGLHYVYAGNMPGQVGTLENTYCHHCRALLIERYGYFVQEYRLTGDGTCPDCGTAIPGRWARQFDGQIAASPFLAGRRRLKVL